MTFPKVEIQPRRSMTLFALLSIFMVVASYVFVVGLAAACVYLPYLALDAGSGSSQIVILFLFGIIIAGAMLWSLLPRPDRFKAPGLLIERTAQPRLFAEIENVAGALNERMPSEVYLVGDVNAWVADRGGLMGFGSRRVMGLGLPLLSILTISQLRAVLAHEFAHYYGGDTSLGPWVYKTQTAIVRIFQNIGSVGKLARVAILGVMYLVVATLMKWYFVVFLRAINLASRKKEYRADELACLIAGRQPLIDGLRAIHGAGLAWPAYWKSELAPMLSDGAVPGLGMDSRASSRCRQSTSRFRKVWRRKSEKPKRIRIIRARRCGTGLQPQRNCLRSSFRKTRIRQEVCSIKPMRLSCGFWRR
jgi:heat shock protein HtpX